MVSILDNQFRPSRRNNQDDHRIEISQALSGFEGLSGWWTKRADPWSAIIVRDWFRTVTYNRHHNKSQAENRAQIDRHQTFLYPNNPKKGLQIHFSLKMKISIWKNPILVTWVIIVCVNGLNRWLKCSLERWVHGCQFCRCNLCCLCSSS